MPYISKLVRPQFAPAIASCRAILAHKRGPGCLNYLLSSIINEYLDITVKPGYGDMNEVMGVLAAVQMELYRRVVAPYEDLKKNESGDVFSPRIVVE